MILTGLRTNGEYHLGNYLGAILPMVDKAKDNSDKFQVNMFAPDLHSFTTPVDHAKLASQTLENLRLLVACGLPIDNPYVYIYRQSYISAHSELAVILNNFAYFGELSRMTQFKDKSKDAESVTAGLFDYPVLMASDILLYGASWIPVGEDQRQHLEFTRDLAIRMNNKFGELFVVPKDIKEQQKLVDRDSAPRIRSLRNPEKKMSKSISDPAGTILLSDSNDSIRKKVMSAVTDNLELINYDWENQPGISNLLQILALTTSTDLDSVIGTWKGKTSYSQLKLAVYESIVANLSAIQHNLVSIAPESLLIKLKESEKYMQEIANNRLFEVQKAVGLR